MAASVTEADLLSELAAHYGRPAVEDDDITAGRIAQRVRAAGKRVSVEAIERDMLRRAAAGEFEVVVKREKNGRDVNVYVCKNYGET